MRPLHHFIPNILTTLRLLLALPIGWLILQQDYHGVLWIAFIAGISDGFDGWLARRWHCTSRYGSVVDPLSDKAMMICAYLSFAVVGLIPWWAAWLILGRDLLIVMGAAALHLRFGHYEMAPSLFGKASTFVQISYALMLLVQQVCGCFTETLMQVGFWTVVLMAFVSGGHYVVVWGWKAVQSESGFS